MCDWVLRRSGDGRESQTDTVTGPVQVSELSSREHRVLDHNLDTYGISRGNCDCLSGGFSGTVRGQWPLLQQLRFFFCVFSPQWKGTGLPLLYQGQETL